MATSSSLQLPISERWLWKVILIIMLAAIGILLAFNLLYALGAPVCREGYRTDLKRHCGVYLFTNPTFPATALIALGVCGGWLYYAGRRGQRESSYTLEADGLRVRERWSVRGSTPSGWLIPYAAMTDVTELRRLLDRLLGFRTLRIEYTGATVDDSRLPAQWRTGATWFETILFGEGGFGYLGVKGRSVYLPLRPTVATEVQQRLAARMSK